MDEVLPGLWIGDLACALSTDYLSDAGVTHIITALGQRLPPPPTLPCGRKIAAEHCYHVRCEDEESQPLLVHFPRCSELLKEILQERWVEGQEGGVIDEQRKSDGLWGHWETTGTGTVLVHCQAGCSRSVALVAAYIMETRRCSRHEALDMIRARRSQAEPNEGFIEQLDLFEKADYIVDLRHAPIRRFLMSKIDLLRGDKVEDLVMSYFPSPATSPALSYSRSRSNSNSSSTSFSGAYNPGSPWKPLTALDVAGAGDETIEARPRRSSNRRRSDSEGADGSKGAMRLDLSKSPPMPTNTDQLFADDQARLRQQAQIPGKADGDDNSDGSSSRINQWATSVSSPHQVMVTRTSGSKQPFDVPSSSLRGHESSANRGSLPKPDYGHGIRLRCRMCRREIASGDHVVEHDVGKGRGAFELRKTSKDERGAKNVDGAGTSANTSPNSSSNNRSSADGLAQRFGAPRREVPSSTPDLASLGLDGDDDNGNSEPSAPAAVSATGRPIQSAASLTASLPPHLAALRARRAPPGAVAAQQDALQQSTQRSAQTAMATGGSVTTAPTKAIDDSAIVDGEDSDERQRGGQKLTRQQRDLLPSASCTSYFLEPLSWMELPTDGTTLSGRLLCPNKRCGSKLGTWDWSGSQCACGAWVVPGFAVLQSRVDEVYAKT